MDPCSYICGFMSLYLWIYVIIFVQTLRMYPLEEEIATHSSILAWKIPWTEEPGGLQSMGPQTFGHACVTSLSFNLIFICIF